MNGRGRRGEPISPRVPRSAAVRRRRRPWFSARMMWKLVAITGDGEAKSSVGPFGQEFPVFRERTVTDALIATPAQRCRV